VLPPRRGVFGAALVWSFSVAIALLDFLSTSR
jgi:hypothetical protein